MHGPVTVNALDVVMPRVALFSAPALQVTVVKEVKAVANVTEPCTVNGPAHDATGVHVRVPVPPIDSAAPFVNRPVLMAAAPVGDTSTTAANVAPFTAPVDTEPVFVTSDIVPAAVAVMLAKLMLPLLSHGHQNTQANRRVHIRSSSALVVLG